MTDRITRNTIQKQYLHIDFNGTEDEGLSLQQKVSEMCEHRLTPAIERVLDRYSPPDEHLSIEDLHLDVGPISAAGLEQELPALVALAVERELYRLVSPGTSSSGRFSEGVRRTAAGRSINEAFIYYLKTGTLPWSFSIQNESVDVTPGSGSPGSPPSLVPVPFPAGRLDLEKMILSAWEKAGKPGRDALDNHDEIVRELARDTPRTRLVRQFSPEFLSVLLSMLSPEGCRQVEKALSAIRSLPVRSEERAAFERLIWEEAFSFVAARHAFSAWDVIAGTHFLPSLGKIRLKAVKNIFHRYFPEEDIPEGLEDYPGKPGSVYGVPDTGSHHELHRTESESLEPEETSQRKNVLADSSRARHPDAAPELSGISPLDASNNQVRPSKKRAGKHKHGASGPGADSKRVIAAKSSGRKKAAPETGGKRRVAASVRRTAASNISPLIAPHFKPETHPEATEGLYIGNAGLVVLHPFLSQFFTGLGIAAGEQLVKPERALCLLHYLATGKEVAPEYDLVLPKIMCGVPLTEPVESQVDLTAAEKTEAEALLQTVIRYWEALRNTSPDGLRSAFLLRQGKIALKEAGWVLRVEPKGFDVLLGSLPWGISMVRLPWMNKLLHVEW